MSLTCGFFNSLNGDRRYNSEQMSTLFDGIINDGVFANIGDAFAVKASSGNEVTVGIGRAWFDSIWVNNDAVLPVTLDASEVVLDRYDAIVIEVDHNESVRDAAVKVIKGTPASEPKHPTMIDTEFCHQHPLAYIYRAAGSTEVTQSNIESRIGTSDCPYITGILQVQTIDNIVAQWEAQWTEWFDRITATGNAELAQWMADTKASFDEWFNGLQLMLEGDVASNLALQILELEAIVADQALSEGDVTTPILADGAVTSAKLASDAKGLFAPAHMYGEDDLQAGVTPLAAGQMYLVYE